MIRFAWNGPCCRALAAPARSAAAQPADRCSATAPCTRSTHATASREAIAIATARSSTSGPTGARGGTSAGDPKVIDLGAGWSCPGCTRPHPRRRRSSDQKTCELERRAADGAGVPGAHPGVPGRPAHGRPDARRLAAGVANLVHAVPPAGGHGRTRRCSTRSGRERPIAVSAAVTGHTTLVNSRGTGAGRASRPPRPTRRAGASTTTRTGSPTACCRTRRARPVFALICRRPPSRAAVELARRADARLQRARASRRSRPGFADAATIGAFDRLQHGRAS